MNIVAFPNPGAARYWRMDHPFKYLRKLGHHAVVADEKINEELLRYTDIVVLKGCVDKEGIALLHYFQEEHGLKIVVDQDDMLEVEDSNPYKMHHDVSQAQEVIKITMDIADAVVATNEYLADRLKTLTKRVEVIPNYMDIEWWDMPKRENKSDRIRIGWAGSFTHLDDLKMIAKPLRQLKKEFPIVEYVFVGDLRFKDVMPESECMLGVPFEFWPAKLHGLQLDIGLAPVRDTEFNRCKSNIKWQEYAVANVPGVYTDFLYNFRGFDSHLGIAVSTQKQWYMALRNLIICPPLREDIKHSAYTYVKTQFNLEKRISDWEDFYLSLT
jgi:glycosyltransferase involved in cell wall biosynthesis